MAPVRNNIKSTSSPSSDAEQERGQASTSTHKPRSQMSAAEKREDTKLKNRLKQRAYRHRLANTITSLTAENATLKTDAEAADSLALARAKEIQQLEDQIRQLQDGGRGQDECEAELIYAEKGLVEPTPRFDFDMQSTPHLSPDATSIVQSPSLLTTPQESFVSSLSPGFLPDLFYEDVRFEPYAPVRHSIPFNADVKSHPLVNTSAFPSALCYPTYLEQFQQQHLDPYNFRDHPYASFPASRNNLGKRSSSSSTTQVSWDGATTSSLHPDSQLEPQHSSQGLAATLSMGLSSIRSSHSTAVSSASSDQNRLGLNIGSSSAGTGFQMTEDWDQGWVEEMASNQESGSIWQA